MMKLMVVFVLLLSFFSLCPAPGIDRSGEEQIDKIYGDIDGMDPKKARNKEFFRYILRVIKVLDQDPAFKKRAEKFIDNESVKQGKLTNGLYEELSHETRTKLDKLKVAEVEFQEKLLAADKTHMLEKEGNEWNPIHQTDKSSFSQKDMDLLLGRYQALSALKDAKRREKFNKHEMEKELKYRESVENAKSDEERKVLEEKEKKHHEKKHEPLHKPLGGAQLREVWEKKGLDPEYFDLKTLFKLHDKDGDGYLDEFELETLFLADLEKAYNEEDPEVDLVERDEELERMREVAMNKVDADGDGKLSLDEVLAAKSEIDFEKDEEYKPLYENGKEFTEEELSEFKDELKKGKEGE